MKILRAGKFLGNGSFKTCYRYGNTQVLLFGLESELDEELDALTECDRRGLPVPKTRKVLAFIPERGDEPEPALLQERLYRVWKPKVFARSVVALHKHVMAECPKLCVDDFQFLTSRSGRIVIHDPIAAYDAPKRQFDSCVVNELTRLLRLLESENFNSFSYLRQYWMETL